MHTELRERIRQYLVETVLNGDPRGLDDRTDLIGAGLLDSFAVIELIRFLQQEFGWQLDASRINAASLQTIASIAEMVSAPLAKDREAV